MLDRLRQLFAGPPVPEVKPTPAPKPKPAKPVCTTLGHAYQYKLQDGAHWASMTDLLTLEPQGLDETKLTVRRNYGGVDESVVLLRAELEWLEQVIRKRLDWLGRPPFTGE